MSRILVKEGVVFKAFPPGAIRMLVALEALALLGRAELPGLPDEIVITSAHDGTHLPTSRHYRDEALDVRSHSFPNQASKDLFRMKLQALLGAKFTVLFEGAGTPNEHFHVQVRRGGTYP